MQNLLHRKVGFLTILGAITYDIYLGIQFSHNSFYHLNPNVFYFAPPSSIPYFITVSIYSIIAISAGFLFLKKLKFSFHLYNLLCIGLITLNTYRPISTYFSDNKERLLGNIFTVLLSVIWLIFINSKVVKEHLEISKKNNLFQFLGYLIFTVIVFIGFRINMW